MYIAVAGHRLPEEQGMCNEYCRKTARKMGFPNHFASSILRKTVMCAVMFHMPRVCGHELDARDGADVLVDLSVCMALSSSIVDSFCEILATW